MNGLVVRESPHGKGVFANRAFKAEELLLTFRGTIYTRDQLPKPYDSVEDHFVQIGSRSYLGPSGYIDDYINHSCKPNAGLKIVGTSVTLIAIMNIRKGKEITWDYSTTMNEDEWEIDCTCGSKNCRRRIRDFEHLPESVRQRYRTLGIVPEYVL